MSEVLEVARLCHAQIERHQLEIIEELQNEPETQKQAVLHQHFINQKLLATQDVSKQLIGIYDSEDFKNLGNENPSKVVASFYTRLADLREYHRKFQQPTAREDEHEGKLELLTDDMLPVNFTAEECYGKYLDLNKNYTEYINLGFNYDDPSENDKKKSEKDKKSQTGLPTTISRHHAIDYSTFLQRLGQFHSIARKYKNDDYRQFLDSLLSYLEDFYHRTHPLQSIEANLKKAIEQFDQKWKHGEVLGWEDMKEKKDDKEEDEEPKGPKSEKKGKLTKSQRRRLFAYKVALLEMKIQRYLEELGDIMQDTLDYQDKKQTRTREERNMDIEREEELTRKALAKRREGLEEEKEEDDEAPTYKDNPLDLPEGWDGKPIPYWLYKLHGLGIEYKCEICSNHSYFGPRAFERHFQEWRHAHGMRCLKIPNTRHFHYVTKIQDALALWDKVRYEANLRAWKPDAEQEYEDSEGRVFNKKTYDDMKRQGLLYI